MRPLREVPYTAPHESLDRIGIVLHIDIGAATPSTRAANVPYFAGEGGVTPVGGNSGAPGSVVTGFTPDLRKSETRLNVALLVKF